MLESLYRLVRDVPDFPKPGILFKDITPILLDPRAFGEAVDEVVAPFRQAGITKVVSVESRGFLLGAPAALVLNAGLVLVRKPGKLPAATRRAEYQLEYGSDVLEVHVDALGAGDRVLIVDDVLATGGTAVATAQLVEESGAQVVGLSFLIELTDLGGRVRIGRGRTVHAALVYPRR
ncbi:MAG: adenine phosphoribosyltransferase [Gemmatimonadales bacterium]